VSRVVRSQVHVDYALARAVPAAACRPCAAPRDRAAPITATATATDKHGTQR